MDERATKEIKGRRNGSTELSRLAKACAAEVRPKYPEGERLAPYLACMSKKARGVSDEWERKTTGAYYFRWLCTGWWYHSRWIGCPGNLCHYQHCTKRDRGGRGWCLIWFHLSMFTVYWAVSQRKWLKVHLMHTMTGWGTPSETKYQMVSSHTTILSEANNAS